MTFLPLPPLVMANSSGMMDWSPSGTAPDLSAPAPESDQRELAMPGEFPLTTYPLCAPAFERIRSATDDGFIYNASKRLCTTVSRAAGAVNTASISIVSLIRRVREAQNMHFRFLRRAQRQASPPATALGLEAENLPTLSRQPSPAASNQAQEAQRSPTATRGRTSRPPEQRTPAPTSILWSPFPIVKPTYGVSKSSHRSPALVPVRDPPAHQLAADLDSSASDSDSTSKSFDNNWLPPRASSGPLKRDATSSGTSLSSAAPDTNDWYHNGNRWTEHADLTGSPTKTDTVKSSAAFGLENLSISYRQTRLSLAKAKTALGDTSKFDIKPLSVEWEAKVNMALKEGHGRLQARDFQKIVPPNGKSGLDAWLNDESINEYLNLVTAHGNEGIKPKTTPRMHAFSTFFYTSLKSGGYQKVARWAKRANIAGKALLDVEKIFIPINPNQSHWTLAVIEPKIKHITHYNSLGGGSKAYLEVICEWLKGELGLGFVKDDWTLDYLAESPQQANTSDCGVFTVTTAKQIMLGVSPLTYGAKDIPTQRMRMVAELVNGALLQAGD